MPNYFFDRRTNLRWHVVNPSVPTKDEAVAVAAEFIKQGAAEDGSVWRQPTFAEAVQQVCKDETFAFDATTKAVWIEDEHRIGVDIREDGLVAKDTVASEDDGLAVVVVSEGKVERPQAKKLKKLSVIGFIDNPTFQKCEEAAAYLNQEYSTEYKISIEKVFAFEYEKTRAQMLADGKIADSFNVVVYSAADGVYTDGDSFIREVCKTTDFRLFDVADDDPQSYKQLARENLMTFLRSTGSKYCWMLIKIGDMVQGRIVFQLHSKELPRTCENFLHLCRGDLPDAKGEDGENIKLHYKGTSFFRVVKNGWVQGGDISGKNGNGGHSVYGRHFPDESFKIPHDAPGILGMANDGEHTNASSFYITTKSSSWMNGKYVAFGRVVEGLNVVEAIHNVATKHNQSPNVPVVIQDCGYLSMD